MSTFTLYHLLLLASLSFAAYIENNAYKEVLVSFSPSVDQRDVDLNKLKTIFTKASQYLLHATRRRSYLSDFLVVVPSSWDESIISSNDFKTKHSISVYVTDVSTASTQHSRKCGERGEFIFLPVHWFNKDPDEDTDLLARDFVRQWSIYRYGVFEEEAMSHGACFSMDGKTWSPSGCYNLHINSTLNIDSRGLPQCHLDGDLNSEFELKSSVMFSAIPPNVTDFCNGSTAFPHSPIARTRHNILCNGKPVWHIIQNNPDFKYGINPPLSETSLPKISIRYYKEAETNILFVLQNSSTTDITTIVLEMRHALSRYLLHNVLPKTNVMLSTFSDSEMTSMNDVVVLDLAERSATMQQLKKIIRMMSEVKEVCLLCAIKNAAEVIKTKGNPNSVTVFIVLSSSALTANVEVFQELDNITGSFFFVLIQDVDHTFAPQGFVDSIRTRRGQVFYLPLNAVQLNTDLNMVFSNILQSPFHLEYSTVVVHKATFTNIGSDIVDRFSMNYETDGELLYTLKCSNGDMLEVKNSGCSDLAELKDNGYLCAMTSDIKHLNETNRSWEFTFEYMRGPQILNCSSLASIRVENLKEPIFLNGWFSHYEGKPGRDALVIYAQVLQNFVSEPEIVVEAYIETPDKSTTIVLLLRDNGNGDPDVKKGDGIYSRYFSSFTTKGLYSVQISVKMSFDVTYTAFSKPLPVGRYKFIGSFSVLESPPLLDVYPPNRIADLEVIFVDHEKSSVTLRWTAPGDDYDYGQVVKYEIKISKAWAALTESGFHTVTDILSPIESEIIPSSSGTTEEHSFRLSSTPLEDSVFFVAVKSVDEGQLSSLSNIVQIFFKAKQNEDTTIMITSTDSSSEMITSMNYSSTNYTDVTITDGNTSRTEELSSQTEEVTYEPSTESNNRTSCNEGHIILLASSIGGGCLFLIICINVIVLLCCFRKRRTPELSRNEIMLPPHNLDIAYKQDISKSRTEEPTIELTEENECLGVDYEDTNFHIPNPSSAPPSLSSHAARRNEYEDYRSAMRLKTMGQSIPQIFPKNLRTFRASIRKEGGEFSRTSLQDESDDRPTTPDDAHVYHLGTV